MSIMVLDIIWQKKENVPKGIHLIGRMSGKYLSGICKIGIPTGIQGMHNDLHVYPSLIRAEPCV